MPAFSSGPIEIVTGKTKEFRFTVIDKLTALPVDISGFTQFRFMVKTNVTDSDNQAAVSKTLSAGITVITPSQGLCDVVVAAADTAALPNMNSSLWGEIQGTDGSGRPWTLWQGPVITDPHLIATNS